MVKVWLEMDQHTVNNSSDERANKINMTINLNESAWISGISRRKQHASKAISLLRNLFRNVNFFVIDNRRWTRKFAFQMWRKPKRPHRKQDKKLTIYLYLVPSILPANFLLMESSEKIVSKSYLCYRQWKYQSLQRMAKSSYEDFWRN